MQPLPTNFLGAPRWLAAATARRLASNMLRMFRRRFRRGSTVHVRDHPQPCRYRRESRRHVALRLSAALPLLTAALGCVATNATRLSQNRMQARIDNIAATTSMLRAHERDSVENLEQAGEFVDKQLGLAARQLQSNLGEAGELLRNDAKRWSANQPLYLREFERQVAGKPEQIVPCAIMLFY